MSRRPTLCRFRWSPERIRARMSEQSIDNHGLRRRLAMNGVPIMPGRLNQWIEGARVPAVENAVAIAKALDCQIEDLIDERHPDS